MKSTHLLFFFPLFALLFYSCQKDEEISLGVPGQKEFSKVEYALWPYFQAFEDEAAERGILVDLDEANITAEIAEIETKHVAGQCTYGSHTTHQIVIDQGFWNNTQSYFYKEMVVFHELGHCYLGRGHSEDTFPNGVCKSIMRSGNGGCFDNFNSTTREAYLDELFSGKP